MAVNALENRGEFSMMFSSDEDKGIRND